MDITSQIALTRQTGLMREMDIIANNLANMSTHGYRREGAIFSEMVQAMDVEGGGVAMTALRTRYTHDSQGAMRQTGGTLDLAIEGTGYFQIETINGPRLTRSGAFTQDGEGRVVNAQGEGLLDTAGVPVFLPPDANSVSIGADGTLTSDGLPIAQIGLYLPDPEASFEREDGVRFGSDAAFIPVEDGRMMQGFLEGANVSPVTEMTRMISVQRAYEFSQSFMEREDERVRAVVRTLGQGR